MGSALRGPPDFVFLLFPDGHLLAAVAPGGVGGRRDRHRRDGGSRSLSGPADYTDARNRHVPNPYTTPGLASFFDGAKVAPSS